jgi:hypothetical protein
VTYREWLKENGFCVNCCIEKTWNNTTMCIECLDKHKERCEITRSESSKMQRKLYLKRKRELCVAFGVCRECLKRDAKAGKRCVDCSIKTKKRYREKGILPRSVRVELGLCYFCGEKAMTGWKTCEKHKKTMGDNLKSWDRDNTNHPWRKIQSAEVKKIKHFKKNYMEA